MTPRDRRVRLPVALAEVRDGEPPRQEAVDPPVLPFPGDACPAGIIRRPRCAASPVEPEARIHVIAQRPVVADVVDVTAIGRAVARDLVDAEPGRQDSAPSSRPHVLEDERQPEYRDFADVQHRRPRHQQVLRDELDLLRCEVVIGNGIVAARDSAAAHVERSWTAACRIADESGAGAPDEPLFTTLQRRADVGDASPAQLDVVDHLSERDYVCVSTLRVAKDEGVASRQDNLRRIVVRDSVTNEERDSARHSCGTAHEMERSCASIETNAYALISGDVVAGPVHQRGHHRIGLSPVDQLFLRRVSGSRIPHPRRITWNRRTRTTNLRSCRHRNAEGDKQERGELHAFTPRRRGSRGCVSVRIAAA